MLLLKIIFLFSIFLSLFSYTNLLFNSFSFILSLIKFVFAISILSFSSSFENWPKDKKFKWITYLSATSVYGDHRGEWVDETSKTNPTSINGIQRLKVEKNWIELSQQYNSPLQIFRLSGIYSNQYNVLKRLKRGEVKIINKKNHFFSRIHVEDIANVLQSILHSVLIASVFNVGVFIVHPAISNTINISFLIIFFNFC